MYELSNIDSFYARNYPLLRECLPIVQRHFEDFSMADTEVEIRIGSIENRRFSNGISLANFERQLAMLEEYPEWDEKSDWEQHVDYFFMSGGVSVRQRVSQSFSGCSAIVKEVQAKTDLQIIFDEVFGVATDGAIRIQRSREIPIVVNQAAVLPTFVRLVQRKSFLYNGQWRFDLSKVWEGKTFNEADRLKTTAPSNCEIEIEYIPGKARGYRSAPVFLAVSILLKALDFFPNAVSLNPL
jgi:hypothetical protein